MKTSLVSLFIFLFSSLAFAQVQVNFKLSPAGSFVGKTSKVQGHVVRSGDKFTASNIQVDLKSLKTGIGLRDEHTQKHLETSKYPTAVLVSATGQGGKGTGVIRIRGIEKPIAGTYKVVGNKLEAQFDLKPSDFNITGVRYMGVGLKDLVQVSVIVPIQ